MVRCQVRLPTAAGWNVTSGVQVPWPAMVVHVSETLKSPSVASPLTETTLARLLVSGTPRPALCVPTGWSGKARLAGTVSARAGTVITPLATRLTSTGELVALPAMCKLPDAAPGTLAVNVTCTAHTAPETRDAPQVEVNAKSPLTVIEEITIGTEPLLVSVTVCAGLVVETVRVGNVSDDGVSVRLGAEGVTAFDAADRGPVPTALVADTLNV